MRDAVALLDNFEHEMIATRIAEPRTFLRKRGRRIVGNVPYRYEADVQIRQFMPNPASPLAI